MSPLTAKIYEMENSEIITVAVYLGALAVAASFNYCLPLTVTDGFALPLAGN